MTGTIANCGSCKFSSPGRGQDNKLNFNVRICRRYPPIYGPVQQQNGMPIWQWMWPILGVNDSCGEHSPSSALMQNAETGQEKLA